MKTFVGAVEGVCCKNAGLVELHLSFEPWWVKLKKRLKNDVVSSWIFDSLVRDAVEYILDDSLDDSLSTFCVVLTFQGNLVCWAPDEDELGSEAWILNDGPDQGHRGCEVKTHDRSNLNVILMKSKKIPKI